MTTKLRLLRCVSVACAVLMFTPVCLANGWERVWARDRNGHNGIVGWVQRTDRPSGSDTWTRFGSLGQAFQYLYAKQGQNKWVEFYMTQQQCHEKGYEGCYEQF